MPTVPNLTNNRFPGRKHCRHQKKKGHPALRDSPSVNYCGIYTAFSGCGFPAIRFNLLILRPVCRLVIWLGTKSGPVVLQNPAAFLTFLRSDITFFFLKPALLTRFLPGRILVLLFPLLAIAITFLGYDK